MNCGQFDKRNAEYSKNFNIEAYFQNLIIDEHSNKTHEKEIVIFDVGAHKGESAKFFRKIFQNSSIYCFEPSIKSAEYIVALNLEKVLVNTVALSNYNGSAKFNIQDISHLSSLHEINRSSQSSLGYAMKETHEVTTVKVMRGDKFMQENNISHIDFLKVDVQANEVNVLEGFSEKINNVKCVFVEISFYDFYSTKSRLKDIETFLPGFDLYDIYEISKNPKTYGTDWATFVYLNANKKS